MGLRTAEHKINVRYLFCLSLRSLQKDFTHAAFTTPIVNFWKDFLEKPLPDPTEVPVWPLSGLGPYHDIPLMPTLTEKERELLTKFAEKQHEYKRVMSGLII